MLGASILGASFTSVTVTVTVADADKAASVAVTVRLWEVAVSQSNAAATVMAPLEEAMANNPSSLPAVML